MTKSVEFTLLNQASEIARLQDELEGLGRQHGLDLRVLHAAQLALEEHLTNVIAYGYERGGDHQIRVRVEIGAVELPTFPSSAFSDCVQQQRSPSLQISRMRKS